MTTVAVYDSKSYTRQFLQAAGAGRTIDWRFLDARLSEGTAPSAKNAEVVCPFVHDRMDRAVLNILAELGVRLIALRCAGFNNVDLDAAKGVGVDVVRVPAYSPQAVAEYTAALLLTLNRKIHRAYYRIREQNFSLHGLMGFNLGGRTAGIVGTGRIGKAVAGIFHGLGMRILAHDIRCDPEWARAAGVEYVDMDRLLTEADVITLHAPLTPDTHHMINADSIAKIKSGAFLVNTSRGKLIDTAALIQALKAKKVAGVALDVYEEEEGIFYEDLSDQILQDDELARLMTFPNVIITAHQGFFTAEALTEIAQTTVANIERYQSGRAYLEHTALVDGRRQKHK